MMVQLRPVMIDPWHRGGMLGGRNFFAAAAGVERPMVRLGQTPAVSSAARAAIGAFIDQALDSLGREIEAANVEADLVSPQALRAQPEDYTQIGLVGTVLAPQEIRSVVLADARALDAIASRIQTARRKNRRR